MALYFLDELYTTHSIMQTVHLNTNIYIMYILLYAVFKRQAIFSVKQSLSLMYNFYTRNNP